MAHDRCLAVCVSTGYERDGRDPSNTWTTTPRAAASATDADPEREAVLADSIGSALLVVLERLSPGERVAFVLHDVFAMPFEDVALVVDRSPEATRQLASRARRRVQGGQVSSDLDLCAGDSSWRHFSPRRGAATSTACWRCSTPTSRSAPTKLRCAWVRSAKRAAPRP
jgi:hypothetical protein